MVVHVYVLDRYRDDDSLSVYVVAYMPSMLFSATSYS
jgi:hypothetical protein